MVRSERRVAAVQPRRATCTRRYDRMAQNPVINQFGQAARRRPNVATPVGRRPAGHVRPARLHRPAPTDAVHDARRRRPAHRGDARHVLLVAGAVAWVALPDRLFAPVLIISARWAGSASACSCRSRMRANAAHRAALLGVRGRAARRDQPRVRDSATPASSCRRSPARSWSPAGMLFVYKIGAIRVTPEVHPHRRRRHHRRLRPDGRQPGRLPVHARTAWACAPAARSRSSSAWSASSSRR